MTTIVQSTIIVQFFLFYSQLLIIVFYVSPCLQRWTGSCCIVERYKLKKNIAPLVHSTHSKVLLNGDDRADDRNEDGKEDDAHESGRINPRNTGLNISII